MTICSVRIPIVRRGTTANQSLDGDTLSGMMYRFELVSPEFKKPILFKTDTEQERTEWMKAIQDTISSNLTNQNFVSSPKRPGEHTKHESLVAPIKMIRSMEGNSVCADCGAAGKKIEKKKESSCNKLKKMYFS